MIRKSVIFWVGLTTAASAVLFQTSYRVQGLEEKLASVHRNILAEQDAIQVLKAEWSFLNEPARLETLARHHLSLKSTAGEQVAALDAGPSRLALLGPMPPRPVAPVPAPAPTQLATLAVPAANAPTVANTTTAMVIPAAVTTAAAKAPVRKPAVRAVTPPADGPARPAGVAAKPAAPRLAPRPAPTDDLGLFLAKLEREP